MINEKRLATTFTRLCETDSPSRREGKIAGVLKKIISKLDPDDFFEDDSAILTGSESGNLFFRFAGTTSKKPIFFNCHMDTVQPGIGVQVQRQGDIFTSAGDTILGSDDKSGIAAFIEAMLIIREQKLPMRPVEFILTTCEEIGLLGAKAVDPKHIRAKIGYALDSSGSGKIIIGAPASNRLNIQIHGVAAHAGLHPEWGINAIVLAAHALAQAPCGKIDGQSTINFGTIQGGTASNIVPERVVIEGEVRSHSQHQLDELTRQVHEVFAGAQHDWQDPSGQAKGKPALTFEAIPDFPLMKLSRSDQVITEVEQAARSIEMELDFVVAGGGSDANIFNGFGLQTAIIATGMTNVHSTEEQVDLKDMVELTRLLLALLTG
jgi:tripeptide aminopeptidase